MPSSVQRENGLHLLLMVQQGFFLGGESRSRCGKTMDFCRIDLAILTPPLTADLVILFPSLCQRSSAAEPILFALYFYFLCPPLLCNPFPLHCEMMADAFNPEFVCLPAPLYLSFPPRCLVLSYTRDKGFSWTCDMEANFCENSPKRLQTPCWSLSLAHRTESAEVCSQTFRSHVCRCCPDFPPQTGSAIEQTTAPTAAFWFIWWKERLALMWLCFWAQVQEVA